MTQDSEEWGTWIEHDGLTCPEGNMVHIVLGDDCAGGISISGSGSDGWSDNFSPISEREAIGIAKPEGSWFWVDGWFPVIKYRIRKPRALRDLITLVETLPAPQHHTQGADE